MFVILDGTVSVEMRGGFHTELGPGNFFGEIALLVPDSGRVARVRAATKVKCLSIREPTSSPSSRASRRSLLRCSASSRAGSATRRSSSIRVRAALRTPAPPSMNRPATRPALLRGRRPHRAMRGERRTTGRVLPVPNPERRSKTSPTSMRCPQGRSRWHWRNLAGRLSCDNERVSSVRFDPARTGKPRRQTGSTPLPRGTREESKTDIGSGIGRRGDRAKGRRARDGPDRQARSIPQLRCARISARQT